MDVRVILEAELTGLIVLFAEHFPGYLTLPWASFNLIHSRSLASGYSKDQCYPCSISKKSKA